MKQTTHSADSFDRYSKTTRRAAFLSEIARMVPWPALCSLIEPAHPKVGNGRPPVGLERMLRIYFLQNRKSSVSAKVEHAFLIINRIFGFAKISYRGMMKNSNRLFVVAAWPISSWRDTICCDFSRRVVSDEGEIDRKDRRNDPCQGCFLPIRIPKAEYVGVVLICGYLFGPSLI